MNNSLISIIVAIYKVEEYLPKCIESILNQAYKNIELILVNDGSPDNSLEICNEYVIKDARVRVINKDNGGQATARNKALDIANGDYIGFVDGDDWIVSNVDGIRWNQACKRNVHIKNILRRYILQMKVY